MLCSGAVPSVPLHWLATCRAELFFCGRYPQVLWVIPLKGGQEFSPRSFSANFGLKNRENPLISSNSIFMMLASWRMLRHVFHVYATRSVDWEGGYSQNITTHETKMRANIQCLEFIRGPQRNEAIYWFWACFGRHFSLRASFSS